MILLTDLAGITGSVTSKKAIDQQEKHQRQCEKKASETVKKRRKRLRGIRKGYLDKEKETEKVTYPAGAF